MSQSEEVLIGCLRGENPGGETENQILGGGVGGGDKRRVERNKGNYSCQLIFTYRSNLPQWSLMYVIKEKKACWKIRRLVERKKRFSGRTGLERESIISSSLTETLQVFVPFLPKLYTGVGYNHFASSGKRKLKSEIKSSLTSLGSGSFVPSVSFRKWEKRMKKHNLAKFEALRGIYCPESSQCGSYFFSLHWEFLV